MPIKIRETEKEGHRKFRTQEPKRYRGLKSDLYGTKTHKKKPYHDKTTLHKSQRHPHSRLKTQKEYKTITDSSAYKKADYHTQNKMLKKHPTTMKAGGSVTRFRSSGPEGKPHSTKEGRSAEAQRAYMRQHGPQEPRRKRLTPADTTHRDRLKKIENLHERMGGGTKAKPHSSREGRVASGKRRLDRYRKKAEDVMSGKPKWPKWKKQPKHVPAKRAKHAIGGAVKTIPKITKKFLDFIKTGKHVDKHGVKVNVPKAAERLTGKPHVDHGKRKRIKHLGKGKAEGGRIGLKKGSVHTPGSHSWWLMNQSKPKRTKKAEGGRVNFRHGGSVGAAIKGHGAEIK